MKKSFVAYILAFLTIFFWGITFVSTKILLVDFSPLEILFTRFLLAYVGLWIIRPKWEKIALKDNLWFVLAALSGVVIYQFSENTAINFTNASNVSVIVSTAPMFAAIICQIFLHQKNLNRFFVTGFVISIAGVVLVSLNGKIEMDINPAGNLLALCAAICWGFYSLTVSVINSRKYDSICSTRRIFFFAVILMLPVMFIGMHTGGDSSFHVIFDLHYNLERLARPKNIINLAFLGFIASGFCFAAWNKACDTLGTLKTTIGIYLIPVVTVIFAFIVLKEKLTLMGAAGSALTIVGLFISSKKSKTDAKVSAGATASGAVTPKDATASGAVLPEEATASVVTAQEDAVASGATASVAAAPKDAAACTTEAVSAVPPSTESETPLPSQPASFLLKDKAEEDKGDNQQNHVEKC